MSTFANESGVCKLYVLAIGAKYFFFFSREVALICLIEKKKRETIKDFEMVINRERNGILNKNLSATLLILL